MPICQMSNSSYFYTTTTTFPFAIFPSKNSCAFAISSNVKTFEILGLIECF